MVVFYLEIFLKHEYEFKSIINENHLNAAGITHGGYLSALIDAGLAQQHIYRSALDNRCSLCNYFIRMINKNLFLLEQKIR